MKITFNTLFYLFLVIVIITFGYIMKLQINENSKCTSNPFVYGAEILEKQDYHVTCLCSSSDSRLPSFSFSINGLSNSLANFTLSNSSFNFSLSTAV